ncbi:MAG: hypothetical protein GH145_01010 [Firmicutes bacterium]|nr:hypothetical protein [Bacillota bacterium]
MFSKSKNTNDRVAELSDCIFLLDPNLSGIGKEVSVPQSDFKKTEAIGCTIIRGMPI